MKKTSGLNQSDSARLRATVEEIPEALRDTPIESSSSSPSPLSRLLAALAIFFGVSALGLVAVLAWMWVSPTAANREPRSPSAAESSDLPVSPAGSDSLEANAPEASSTTAAPAAPADPEAIDLLGHLPYDEAPLEDLVPVTADGYWELRSAAANSFLEMQAAARAEGFDLSVLSAYRTIEEQQSLFFDIKAQRGQVASERAEVSAPPGYSEHHTGYAIDIGDVTAPETDFSEEFERTPGFAWLAENAAYYSFELSFPRGNEQGIAYEPWHWRFVGDRDSLETFYRARTGEDRPQGSAGREGKTQRGIDDRS